MANAQDAEKGRLRATLYVRLGSYIKSGRMAGGGRDRRGSEAERTQSQESTAEKNVRTLPREALHDLLGT